MQREAELLGIGWGCILRLRRLRRLLIMLIGESGISVKPLPRVQQVLQECVITALLENHAD